MKKNTSFMNTYFSFELVEQNGGGLSNKVPNNGSSAKTEKRSRTPTNPDLENELLTNDKLRSKEEAAVLRDTFKELRREKDALVGKIRAAKKANAATLVSSSSIGSLKSVIDAKSADFWKGIGLTQNEFYGEAFDPANNKIKNAKDKNGAEITNGRLGYATGHMNVQTWQNGLIAAGCCPSGSWKWSNDGLFGDETLAETIIFQKICNANNNVTGYSELKTDGTIGDAEVRLLTYLVNNGLQISEGSKNITVGNDDTQVVKINWNGSGFTHTVNNNPTSPIPTGGTGGLSNNPGRIDLGIESPINFIRNNLVLPNTFSVGKIEQKAGSTNNYTVTINGTGLNATKAMGTLSVTVTETEITNPATKAKSKKQSMLGRISSGLLGYTTKTDNGKLIVDKAVSTTGVSNQPNLSNTPPLPTTTENLVARYDIANMRGNIVEAYGKFSSELSSLALDPAKPEGAVSAELSKHLNPENTEGIAGKSDLTLDEFTKLYIKDGIGLTQVILNLENNNKLSYFDRDGNLRNSVDLKGSDKKLLLGSLKNYQDAIILEARKGKLAIGNKQTRAEKEKVNGSNNTINVGGNIGTLKAKINKTEGELKSQFSTTEHEKVKFTTMNNEADQLNYVSNFELGNKLNEVHISRTSLIDNKSSLFMLNGFSATATDEGITKEGGDLSIYLTATSKDITKDITFIRDTITKLKERNKNFSRKSTDATLTSSDQQQFKIGAVNTQTAIDKLSTQRNQLESSQGYLNNNLIPGMQSSPGILNNLRKYKLNKKAIEELKAKKTLSPEEKQRLGELKKENKGIRKDETITDSFTYKYLKDNNIFSFKDDKELETTEILDNTSALDKAIDSKTNDIIGNTRESNKAVAKASIKELQSFDGSPIFTQIDNIKNTGYQFNPEDSSTITNGVEVFSNLTRLFNKAEEGLTPLIDSYCNNINILADHSSLMSNKYSEIKGFKEKKNSV